MDRSSSTNDPLSDFAALLEESFEELGEIGRGDMLPGTILAIDSYGIIVDVGLKRDGVIPRSDLETMEEEPTYEVGQHVTVLVVNPEDRDGNLIVSIRQALASKDWDHARRCLESGEIVSAEVVAANRGGLLVPFGDLRGFVPASHVIGLPRGLDDQAREQALRAFIGRELELKVIEVNPRRRRLVLSQRQAQREAREEAKSRLLDRLNEGDIVTGRVSSLRDFGAFVDLGGADGLIHVSELAWQRVRHPGEILRVGQEVSAYVLQLDREKSRIGLSLKRLQPNPWVEIEESCTIGQVVEGTVTRVVSFGAFVELGNGIEALLHISEMGDPPPVHVEDRLAIGDCVNARVISLEPNRQRMGLSIRQSAAEGRDEPAPDDAVEPVEEEPVSEPDTV